MKRNGIIILIVLLLVAAVGSWLTYKYLLKKPKNTVESDEVGKATAESAATEKATIEQPTESTTSSAPQMVTLPTVFQELKLEPTVLTTKTVEANITAEMINKRFNL